MHILIESYIAQFGRHGVVQDRVIHRVETSLFPNGVGVDRERGHRLDGNRLTLGAAPMLINGKSRRAPDLGKKLVGLGTHSYPQFHLLFTCELE